MQTPTTNNINLFPLFSNFNFSSSYEKERKDMQNIIIPQAIADFNENLYKPAGCILFLVCYILDLGNHMSFLQPWYVSEVNEEWRLWQAETRAFLLIDNTNSDDAKPRLEFLERK